VWGGGGDSGRGGGGDRRRGCDAVAVGLVFLVLLVAVPILELWVFVQAADAWGFGWALLAVVATSVGGLWLVKVAGLSAMKRGTDAVQAGRAPTRELMDGALLLVAGGLLLFPGFVTGAVGLLLLLPPVRALVRPLLLGWWGRGRRSGRIQVIDATSRGPETDPQAPVRGELIPPPDDRP
jgi:UPF0716 protein FxsA